MDWLLSAIGIGQPQTQAAVLQGFLSLIGIVATGLVAVWTWRRNQSAERRRQRELRDERVMDFVVALQSEIAADLLNLEVADRTALLGDVAASYAKNKSFSALVPRMASNVIFQAILTEVHILPGIIIAPVINYARFRETIEQFIDDLRGDAFRRLGPDRQLAMVTDYYHMLDRLEALARLAHLAIEKYLSVSSSGAVRSTQGSASGQDAASAEVLGEP